MDFGAGVQRSGVEHGASVDLEKMIGQALRPCGIYVYVMSGQSSMDKRVSGIMGVVGGLTSHCPYF